VFERGCTTLKQHLSAQKGTRESIEKKDSATKKQGADRDRAWYRRPDRNTIRPLGSVFAGALVDTIHHQPKQQYRHPRNQPTKNGATTWRATMPPTLLEPTTWMEKGWRTQGHTVKHHLVQNDH
jgi:hypothetical protein